MKKLVLKALFVAGMAITGCSASKEGQTSSDTMVTDSAVTNGTTGTTSDTVGNSTTDTTKRDTTTQTPPF